MSRATGLQELSLRDPEEFTESLKYTLDLITLNEVPRVVGPAAYLAHRYPSDVDVFEQVTVSLPQEEALDFYVDQFKNVMERLLVNSEEIKFSDFKAGLDERFDYTIIDGTTLEERENLAVKIANSTDLPEMLAVNLFRSAKDTDKFREAIHNLKTIRWTPEEVIQGYKYLIDDVEITLKQALAMNAIVKLDVISWISGRFQSVEAFYDLRYFDPVQNRVFSFHPVGSYAQALVEDIMKYSSKRYYSPLKVIERLWSWSRLTRCTDLLRALTPSLRSNVAALSQIVSDSEVLRIIIKKDLTSKQMEQVFSEILGFHKRAANHLTGEVYQDFEGLIDLAFPVWVRYREEGVFSIGALDEILTTVKKFLQPMINERSEEFLRAVDKLGISCPYSQPEETFTLS